MLIKKDNIDKKVKNIEYNKKYKIENDDIEILSTIP